MVVLDRHKGQWMRPMACLGQEELWHVYGPKGKRREDELQGEEVTGGPWSQRDGRDETVQRGGKEGGITAGLEG